ncbi:MAG: MBL fold metallo-hydrolase [Terriglobia bacterium]
MSLPSGGIHISNPGQVAPGPLRSRLFAPLLILAALASALGPRPAGAIGRDYQVREIAPHSFLWIPDDIMDQNGDPLFSRAGNVGFVVTNEGVVVINTANNPFHAREVLYEIRQRTDLPVRLVIDLGAQGDQVLGNEVFAEQHAVILSTAAAAAQMRTYRQRLAHRMTFDSTLPERMRGIHFTLPTRTFQGETTFNMGAQEVRVRAFDCGAGAAPGGDAVVYLPAQRALFLGDLYVNGYVPEIGGRDVQRWIGALGRLSKWNAITYIPGHGDPGSVRGVLNFQGFLEWLDAGVQAGLKEGKPLAQVEARLLPSSAFNLLARDLAPLAVATVYEQLIRRGANQKAGRSVAPQLSPNLNSARPAQQNAAGFTHSSRRPPQDY